MSSLLLRRSLYFLLLGIAEIVRFAEAEEQQDQGPWKTYISRPDILAPSLNIRIHTADALASSPGYIFLSTSAPPNPAGNSSSISASIPNPNGKYIYTPSGDLIYSSDSTTTEIQPHPSFFSSNESSVFSVFQHLAQSRNREEGRTALAEIYNSSYQVIRKIEAPSHSPSPSSSSSNHSSSNAKSKPPAPLSFHDFFLLENKNETEEERTKYAITLSSQPRQMDLYGLGVKEGMGWVVGSGFQVRRLKGKPQTKKIYDEEEERNSEEEEEKDKVVFEWDSLQHVSVHESMMSLTHRGKKGKEEGLDGRSYMRAWDYFHINSIDRFQNGDFLVSAQNTNTVYRISGQDGTVVWRLGGKNSSFKLLGFKFSAQHDARVVEEGMEEGRFLTLSLFDNNNNNHADDEKSDGVSSSSSAIFVKLDLELGLARVLKQFSPLNGGVARDQGSVRLLPNGNTLVSWGTMAEFSEFDARGERILDVAFGDETTMRGCRFAKSEWVGRPKEDALALYLYAKTQTAPTHFWMSWNGATEVQKWLVYADASTLLGEVENGGFETHFDAGRFVGRGYVEAVGENGEVLGRSKRIETFMPTARLAEVCGDEHCTLQVFPVKDKARGTGKAGFSERLVRFGGHVNGLYMIVWFVIGLFVGKMPWVRLVNGIRSRVTGDRYASYHLLR